MNLVKFLGHLIKSAEAPCSADGEMVYLIPIFFGNKQKLGEVIGKGGKKP